MGIAPPSESAAFGGGARLSTRRRSRVLDWPARPRRSSDWGRSTYRPHIRRDRRSRLRSRIRDRGASGERRHSMRRHGRAWPDNGAPPWTARAEPAAARGRPMPRLRRPEMLGRLQLRAIGRQEDEADPVRDGQAPWSVPAGIVEHEDDAALSSSTGLARRRRAVRRRRASRGRRSGPRPSRRWSAARRRSRAAIGSDGARARPAAGRRGPRPGGGSASGRGGARPPPRPRPAARDAPPWPVRPPRRAPFEVRPLLGRRRPWVPWSRCLDGPLDPLQRFPAALRVHLRQAEVGRDPGGDLGAAPDAAILGRRRHALDQGGQRFLGQQAGRPAVPPPLVAQRRGAAGAL